MGIVISGIGVVSSIGIGKEEFLDSLKKGISGVKEINLFDTKNLKTKRAAFIEDFRPEDILGQKGLRTLDRATKLLLCAGQLAIEDAKLTNIQDTTEIAVSVGTTLGSIASISGFDKVSLTEGPRFVNPADFPNTVINSPASQLAIRFAIKGPCSTISNGFTSSLDAIKYAIDLIKDNHAKIVLVGGVEELCEQIYLSFYRLKFLAGINGEEISCPFDLRRNGIIFGEGSVVFVVEDEETAIKRSAPIYGYVRSYSTYFFPYAVDKYEPTGFGLKKAIESVISKANLSISEIDYICAASNSTKELDYIETKVIKEVFGKNAKDIPISSIKSMIGETFSASGAFSVLAGILSINNSFVPPTINYKQKDPQCDLNYVVNNYKETTVKNVLINAVGPTGINSCMIVSKNSLKNL